MSTFVAGLIGTAVGLGLKWLADLMTERLRHTREDRVWRRERFVEAAADLLALSNEVVSANERIAVTIYSLGNAEGRTDKDAPAVVAQYSAKLQELHGEHNLLVGPSSRAVQIIRLYGPVIVAEKAKALRTLSNETPGVLERRQHWEAVQALQAEFVDLVRANT